jgi:hypothetical protein
MRWVIGVLVMGALGSSLGLAAPTVGAEKCAPDSAESGNICIDRYEASVWQTRDANLIKKIKKGKVKLADLTAAGALQLGLALGDLAAAGCPNTGNGCVNVYAVSIPGVTPAGLISWFQAVATARNSGKRLPTNAEWQAAALGTPDSGVDDEATTCNISGPPFAITLTGSRSNCVSDVGASDMVGNLDEMVAEWVQKPSGCGNWPAAFGTDFSCLNGAAADHLPSVLIRGGAFGNGPGAGVFAALGSFLPPLIGDSSVGFRAAR